MDEQSLVFRGLLDGSSDLYPCGDYRQRRGHAVYGCRNVGRPGSDLGLAGDPGHGEGERTMKWAALATVTLAVAISGCDETEQRRQEQDRQSSERPVRIAEVDGIRVWKIRDTTPGGREFVYFVTGHPQSAVIEQAEMSEMERVGLL